MVIKKYKLNSKRDSKIIVGVFRDSLYGVSRMEAYKYAKKLQLFIKRVIKEQTFKWKPLSEDYKEYKLGNKLDPRIYIASGEYLKKIVVRKTKKGYYVGLAKGIHSKAKVPYGLLAAWLEFGNKTIPARPLWRPALSIFSKRGLLKK